jgi:hypothetical protein
MKPTLARSADACQSTSVEDGRTDLATDVANALALLRTCVHERAGRYDALEAEMNRARRRPGFDKSYICRVLNGERPLTLPFLLALPDDVEALFEAKRAESLGRDRRRAGARRGRGAQSRQRPRRRPRSESWRPRRRSDAIACSRSSSSPRSGAGRCRRCAGSSPRRRSRICVSIGRPNNSSTSASPKSRRGSRRKDASRRSTMRERGERGARVARPNAGGSGFPSITSSRNRRKREPAPQTLALVVLRGVTRRHAGRSRSQLTCTQSSNVRSTLQCQPAQESRR